jgi:hypothetical protein
MMVYNPKRVHFCLYDTWKAKKIHYLVAGQWVALRAGVCSSTDAVTWSSEPRHLNGVCHKKTMTIFCEGGFRPYTTVPFFLQQ